MTAQKQKNRPKNTKNAVEKNISNRIEQSKALLDVENAQVQTQKATTFKIMTLKG